ncbi:MAG: sulfatase-like hydrolase/transferase [Chloracidobacterium sp.]|nr:sulfatase-like hydrolase/transferase [Chloracidobacterium sp.]
MNRRNFLVSATAGALAMPLFGYQPSRKPNMLYILVDQLSGLALPGMDSNARMPNTQKLMKSGVHFSHAYTAGMTCGPSRASLDTGLYTQTHGVGGGFRLDSATPQLPTLLVENGYVISHPDGYNLESERALHEKWLAEMGYPGPVSSINGSEQLARYLDLPLKWRCGRAGVAPEHGFESFCANRAIRFLEVNKDKQFACFLQLRGPHDPYMVPRPYDTLIDPASLALPPYRAGELANKPLRQQKSFESQGAAKMTDEQIRQALALYYGMAAYSDYCLGQVLNRLDELRLTDKTIVVMVSDHGDTMGRHRFMSKDFAFYEPAIRIPMIYRAAGRKSGIVCADPVSGVDVFPTLCDLLSLPQAPGLAGQSLLNRWEGKESHPERAIFSAQGTPGKNRAVMMRTPSYKLTRYDDGGGELYDLLRDPDELVNLIDDPARSSIKGQLTRQLEEWERRYPHRV